MDPRSSTCGASSSTRPSFGHMDCSSSTTFFQFCITVFLILKTTERRLARLPGASASPDHLQYFRTPDDPGTLALGGSRVVDRPSEKLQHRQEVITGCA